MWNVVFFAMSEAAQKPFDPHSTRIPGCTRILLGFKTTKLASAVINATLML